MSDGPLPQRLHSTWPRTRPSSPFFQSEWALRHRNNLGQEEGHAAPRMQAGVGGQACPLTHTLERTPPEGPLQKWARAPYVLVLQGASKV